MAFLPSLEPQVKSYDIGGRDSDRKDAEQVDLMRWFMLINIWGRLMAIRA